MDRTLPSPGLRLAAVFALCLLFLFGAAPRADAADWILRVEPVYVDVQGHDPNVVNASGSAGGSGALNLETDSNTGYHFELRRKNSAKKWGWGLDFFWFTGAQKVPRHTAAADAGGSPVVFEIADGSFTSTSPGEVLYLERLEDTDMNAWTADVYALRNLSARGLQLLLGVRNADFDNDNHAVVGIEGVGGTRIDASSNYGRMLGPIVGILVGRERGKNRFEFSLTQSVVQGDADLSAMQSDFLGPFSGDSQEFTAQREFSSPKSVSIPITDLRARWSYAASQRVAFGLGATISLWTDVSVPPGVQATGSLNTPREASITLVGLVVAVQVDF